MQDFRVTRIAPGIYSILDAGDSSFYVVEGKDRSAVIDTGITPGGKILPVVRRLTDKPLLLVITHAHGDHMYHMDEFDEVYMCHEELALLADRGLMGGKELHPGNTIDVRTGSIIDIGDDSLEICQVPGHTPGSIVVLEKKHNKLFTGDAIGSGYGVWMQVPGATDLETYYASLIHMLKWLVDRGGRMEFWGGHSYQQFQSTLIPNYNPLNMGLLADLIDLVNKIICGEIVGRASNADKIMSLEPARYASFGRAEIQYMPSNIRKE